MSTIVKLKNSKTGITYAYESVPYYDPETKQSRPKRKYLGRVDDATGEIIDTKGTRGKNKRISTVNKDKDAKIDELANEVNELKKMVVSLNKKIIELKKNNEYIKDEAKKIVKAIEGI